jgi:hypothetical protein
MLARFLLEPFNATPQVFLTSGSLEARPMGFVIRPLLLVVVVSLACIGCEENDPIDGGVEPPENRCVDHDNDGYGLNCTEGLDCDDLDETVWESCEPDPDRCNIPRAGCPCEEEDQEIACRTSEPVVSDDGSSLCYAGLRVCQDGTWTSCDNMEPYLPIGSDGPAPGDDGAHRDTLLATRLITILHIYDEIQKAITDGT